MILRGGSTMDTEGDRGVHIPPSGLNDQPMDMNAQTKTWVGSAREGTAIPRTMERDEAHYTAFLLGSPSLQAAGCGMQHNLKLSRAWVILCILHLTMAIGGLLGELIDREDRGTTLRSLKTCKTCCRRAVQVRVFAGKLPRMGKKGPIFFRHGRIL